MSKQYKKYQTWTAVTNNKLQYLTKLSAQLKLN